MDSIKQLRAYITFNEQEQRDKEEILRLLDTQENLFLRENSQAHMTASAWVVNHSMDKFLMVYHNLYLLEAGTDL